MSVIDVPLHGLPNMEPLSSAFQGLIEKVNQLRREAEEALKRLYRGESSEDEVLVAHRRAQVALEMLMQERKRLKGLPAKKRIVLEGKRNGE